MDLPKFHQIIRYSSYRFLISVISIGIGLKCWWATELKIITLLFCFSFNSFIRLTYTTHDGIEHVHIVISNRIENWCLWWP